MASDILRTIPRNKDTKYRNKIIYLFAKIYLPKCQKAFQNMSKLNLKLGKWLLPCFIDIGTEKPIGPLIVNA